MLLTIINHVTTVYMTIFMFFYSKKNHGEITNFSMSSQDLPGSLKSRWNLWDIYGTSMGNLWEMGDLTIFNHI